MLLDVLENTLIWEKRQEARVSAGTHLEEDVLGKGKPYTIPEAASLNLEWVQHTEDRRQESALPYQANHPGPQLQGCGFLPHLLFCLPWPPAP